MNIEIKDRRVFINGKLIFLAELAIIKFINIGEFIILVLLVPDGEINNQNVVCIDFQGKLIWKIEKKEYHNPDCNANNIYIESKKVLVYRWCGIEEEININTGEILSSLLIK